MATKDPPCLMHVKSDPVWSSHWCGRETLRKRSSSVGCSSNDEIFGTRAASTNGLNELQFSTPVLLNLRAACDLTEFSKWLARGLLH
ncbi:hypothetical protein TNCV_2206921 [Trichonephila clavipes]|uniref:Uncharacterized protein n=1 Tax=Trichonephila clavipes TaxID=2585209 RepID=A0A8X6S2I7_TRICX|nr:hypothetical protein TNCV_2206921 [Trichonephila clavipes]